MIKLARMSFVRSFTALSLAAGWMLSGHAAPVVDPATQPALVLAPYVPKNSDLLLGPTKAYRTWFENGGWQGDLIEYNLSADGVRTTDVLVGANPADAGISNWSARARFDAAESADSTWWQGRGIYTTNGTGLGTLIDFVWGDLTAAQKSALDPETAGTPSANDDFDSPLLNYLRGDRSLERDKAGGVYRIRYNILGALINSTPSYAAYASDDDPYASERVFVGANDGMVHAFDAKNGDEVWAFVPSMLMGKLAQHAKVPYDIVYMVDGQTRYANAFTGYDPDDGSVLRKRVLTMGLGAGAKGLFALDVDDADEPALLWEIHSANPDVGSNVGYIHGNPRIARIGGTPASSTSYVLTGNGYGSTSGKAVLFRIDFSGNVLSIVADNGTGNGLGPPALFDLNDDGLIDYAYAGDLKGNLWRFDLAANSASKVFAAGASKPITVQPDVARHPQGGAMITFGTGSVLSKVDADSVDQQTVYGVRDLRTGEVADNTLVTQTLSEATAFDKQLRLATDNTVDYTTHKGWKVNLPVSSERLITRPQIRGGRAQFVTTVTSGEYPAGWLMQLNYLTGGSSSSALFDISSDGQLTSADGVTVDGTLHYPVGRFLGNGNFSHPTLLRLQRGIDVSYINGLLLPFSPLVGAELVFGGDIDVTTDSPSGPVVSKVAGYPNPDSVTPASDGLGNRIDGHVHGYDKLHNVKFVDFFQLEPRRGLARLDAALANGQPINIIRELNRTTEVYSPGTSTVGFGNTQKFIVTLTNADLSKGVDLQIGCRTWNAYDYQKMITTQLRAGTAPASLVDTYHGNQSLIFTIDDILNANCGETNGTLRLTVTDRVGKDGVLHATLPKCVNNTADYDGNPKPVSGTVQQLNPHITPVQESSAKGWRWRNGALTAQLLKVNSNNTSAYTIQNGCAPTYKLSGTNMDGGAFAQAYVPNATSGGQACKSLSSLVTGNASGLLYELTMFWHHGDLYDFQQSGQPPKCYGASNYNANTSIDTRGINLGQYNSLVDAAGRALIEGQYAQALEALSVALGSGDEAAVNTAVVNLGTLLQNAALAAYHNLRSYAPGVVPTQHLLEIDRNLNNGGGGGGVADDQTPSEVDDVTQDDNPIRGPNFVPGRRTWIDLLPR